MGSIKGMVWGTPEFIHIAKQAEKQGELQEAMDKVDEIGLLELTLNIAEWSELRSYVADEFGLENTYRDCDCECF